MKTCKVCGTEYAPYKRTQKVCSLTCALEYAGMQQERQRKREQRKALAEGRERLKTRSDWQREAQAAFNAFVRVRDEGNPCVSCGSMPGQRYGGAIDAGHYRSTGSAPGMRFHLLNVWGQCKRCNRELGGNPIEYRKHLVARLGEARVTDLEHDSRSPQYRADELKRIKRIFRRRARIYRKIRKLRDAA